MRVFLKARISEWSTFQGPSLTQTLIVASKKFILNSLLRPINSNEANSINEKRSYTSFDKYPGIVGVGNSKYQNR